MIGEAAIAGVTVCFVACLRFTRYVIERSDPFTEKNPFTEKRRILERDREEWGTCTGKDGTHLTDRAVEKMKEIDDRLIALADEEIHARDIDRIRSQ
jgi:hypothetical protein